MKLFLTILLTLFCSARTMAQNESLLPLFDQAKSYFCPALTADLGKTNAYVIGGYQYFNYSANQTTAQKRKINLNIDYSSPIFVKGPHRLSLGGFYSFYQNYNINSSLIYQNNLRINIAYSYAHAIGTFSIGTYFDQIDMKTDLTLFKPGYIENSYLNNYGLGIAYRSKNERFYAGVSVNNLYKQYLYTKGLPSNFMYYYTTVDTYLTSGIELPVNKNLDLTPAINIWYNFTTILNANLMAQYKKKYLLGLQFNSNGLHDMGGFRLGYKTKILAFHYAYCMYLSRIAKVSSGQHTLGIVYTPKRD